MVASKVVRLYQAVLRDPDRPIWVRLHRTFSPWVQEKGFPAPDPAPTRYEHEVGDARLTMERRDGCGRYILDEPHGTGRLRTTAVFLDGRPGWTLITVDQFGGPPQDGTAPGFVPAYLRTARITDGAVHLEDTAAVVTEDDLPRFQQALSDPRRRVPIVVVTPSDEAAGHAAWLAAAVAGAGVVARLADQRAEKLLNRWLGPDLAVYGGAIRTYATRFDPATERTPHRHPPMRPAKLRKEGDLALAKIADGVLGRAIGTDLPDEIQRSRPVVFRVLKGQADARDLTAAMTPRPAPVDPAKQEMWRKMMAVAMRSGTAAKPASAPEPEPAAPDPAPPAEEAPSGLAHQVAELVAKEMREELETALGLAAGSDTARQLPGELQLLRQDLTHELRALGLHLAGLRDLLTPAPPPGLEELRQAHRQLQEEYAEAVTTTRQLAERVRWLERRLAESGDPVYGVATPEEVFQPRSIAETLVKARDRLTHVVIGDTDATAVRLDLAHPALSPAWAAKAWDALCALDDFARARSAGEFAGGFYDWCAQGVPGRRIIPLGMLAMRESASVTGSAKFSEPRVFPVPTAVHPTGRILMEAHVKLRPVGYPAPRMYFHDDSGGVTGKIWVGYLGDHLPNTRTN